MRVGSAGFVLLLVLALGCGHYGPPQRPKPQAPPAQTNEPAQADRDGEDPENSAGKPEAKPSAEASPGAY